MKGFERLRSQRNVEKDRRSFVEEVSSVSIAEIPATFDETSSQRLAESIKETKLFILGETHGVQENVHVIYTLFRRYGFRQLALEWDPRLTATVERFIGTGEIDFDAIKESPDGRITAGHFALLKRLTDENLIEKLICFDDRGKSDWNARDAAMAERILAHLSDVPTLVVAGNLHAEVAPLTLEDEPGERHPMGEQVKKRIPEVASGRIEYRTGQYQNYGTQAFEPLAEKTSSEARFYQNTSGLYIFELPQAHAAIVPNPDERI